MATVWASEYVLKEKILGSLEPGKLADLLVLNRDYFTVPEAEIGTVTPILTMVAGKIVNENSALRGKTHGPQMAEFAGKEAPGVIE